MTFFKVHHLKKHSQLQINSKKNEQKIIIIKQDTLENRGDALVRRITFVFLIN